MQKRYDESWSDIFSSLFKLPEIQQLSSFIQKQRSEGINIFPAEELVFNAFQLTPLHNLRVVLLGQDPYHGPGQAHGLSFSVQKGVNIPPSLRNIYKELSEDIPGFISPTHGDLTGWAKQGVLLLNATLTVEAHQAGSHQNKGWEVFTDHIISSISQQKEAVVFILWGSYAYKKAALIDQQKHLILHSAHPSPLSAYRGFFGCRHFSKANNYLTSTGQQEIDWQIYA